MPSIFCTPRRQRIRTFMRWAPNGPKSMIFFAALCLGTVGEPIQSRGVDLVSTEHRARALPHCGYLVANGTGSISDHAVAGNRRDETGLGHAPFPGIEAQVVGPQGNEVGRERAATWCSRSRGLRCCARFTGTLSATCGEYWSPIPDTTSRVTAGKIDGRGYYWLLGPCGRRDERGRTPHLRPTRWKARWWIHASVAEAAVIGRSHEVKGQGISAFVTLKESAHPSDALKEELRQHVGKENRRHCASRRYFLYSELPKTRSAKIMRRLLRDIAEGRVLGDVTTLADPAGDLQAQVAIRG